VICNVNLILSYYRIWFKKKHSAGTAYGTVQMIIKMRESVAFKRREFIEINGADYAASFFWVS
jgi:hypothetical protein